MQVARLRTLLLLCWFCCWFCVVPQVACQATATVVFLDEKYKPVRVQVLHASG
jgi:hypothetical protein